MTDGNVYSNQIRIDKSTRLSMSNKNQSDDYWNRAYYRQDLIQKWKALWVEQRKRMDEEQDNHQKEVRTELKLSNEGKKASLNLTLSSIQRRKWVAGIICLGGLLGVGWHYSWELSSFLAIIVLGVYQLLTCISESTIIEYKLQKLQSPSGSEELLALRNYAHKIDSKAMECHNELFGVVTDEETSAPLIYHRISEYMQEDT